MFKTYLHINNIIGIFNNNKGVIHSQYSLEYIFKIIFEYFFCGYFVIDIKDIIKEIKWFFQRAKRGWADCDVWCAYAYLGKVIYNMLIKIKEEQLGYPVRYTQEEWNNILNKMIEGFKLAGDDEDFFGNKNLKYFKKEFKEIYAKDIENYRKLEIALDLFKENFLSLWD